MAVKRRVASKPFLITEILNQMHVEKFMEKSYILHKDSPKTPIRRIRMVVTVLEKRTGVSKNGIRYAIFKVTDGTGIIVASVFGKPEETAEVTEGDIIEIVGRIVLSEFKRNIAGRETEVVEWQIQTESISKKDVDFLYYFSLQLFEIRSPLTNFLEELYIDKVFEIRHLQSTNYKLEKVLHLKQVLRTLLKSRSDEVDLEFIFGLFDIPAEECMTAIYELKQEGSVVQPEFGKLRWTGYSISQHTPSQTIE